MGYDLQWNKVAQRESTPAHHNNIIFDLIEIWKTTKINNGRDVIFFQLVVIGDGCSFQHSTFDIKQRAYSRCFWIYLKVKRNGWKSL